MYIGQDAWNHLATQAGATMSRFLELYVHAPIQTLLREAPDHLPKMTLEMAQESITINVAGEILTIQRDTSTETASQGDEMPEDIDDDTVN